MAHQRPHPSQLWHPLPIGLPAGEYALEVTGWDERAQRPLGTPQTVQTITLPPQPAALTSGVLFPNGLRLAEVAVPDTTTRPGLLVPIAPLWQGEATAVHTPNLRVDWQLVGQQGVLTEGQEGVGANWLAELPPYTAVRNHMGLLIPTTAPAGTYALRWRLVQDGQPVTARWGREWHTLGEIVVAAWPFITEPPEMKTAVNAQWGDEMTLLGYDGTQTAAQLTLNLVWRAEQTPRTSYFVFVHLTSAATGEIVRQQDWFPAEAFGQPRGGGRPKSSSTPHLSASQACLRATIASP
ncbi:MAG: hypothetical protein IPL28_03155 [Chloroflexi bacterium]|nr:hypothetical protein [Chloroflexota bacterium]